MSTAEILTLLSILREAVNTAEKIKNLLENEDLTEDQKAEIRKRIKEANQAWETAAN